MYHNNLLFAIWYLHNRCGTAIMGTVLRKARGDSMFRITRALKNYIVDALLLIVLGIVMVAWPQGTLETIFKWIGVGMIVIGAIKIILFFVKKDSEQRSWVDLAVGAVQIIAGIFFIAKPAFLVEFFPTVAAILLGYGAIVMIVRAVKMIDGNKTAFTLSLVLGIVTLVLAVIVFVHPVALANVMVQAAGVSMIVEGIALLIVLSR